MENLFLVSILRDSLLLPQVLFLWSKKKGGEGVEATENGKLVEKPEENGMGEGVYKHKT